ncbi:helix-turn-helix domain-containing protein [Rhodoferax aquaticus]|uniref:Bacteriophage CI repressor N-terminal domain-containing protein n=1 Tax=Rhodoferax aquaticus TaxID=2527691 RepID=A0A515ES67_9BURK|nr:helix-turn-helix domain-containing protein [Rhodoferax aquaticus]QDL55505.1 hypothetical protein EXZ61_15730 [Rhodoferax aquaticus]
MKQAEIFSRVREVVGARQDSDVAAALGVTAANYATWKARGTVPYEKLCELAVQRKISLDWLLLGVGDSAGSGAIDVDLFSSVFHALWRGANEIGGDDTFPYVLSNACAIYSKLSSIADRVEQSKVLTMRVNLALGSLAHATVSVLRQQEVKNPNAGRNEQEILRISALAKSFDKAA